MRASFGSFVLDSERRELKDGVVAVHLTPKAFDLLVALITRRPRAVPQAELFDALWPDTFVDTSSLHKLIHELRVALGDRERRIIRTVFGRGFAFAAEVASATSRPAASFELQMGSTHLPLHEGENLIGRDRTSDIRLHARSVSRRHARIFVTGMAVHLEDLGSKNGTYIDGQRVHTSAALVDHSVIEIGEVMMTFVSTPGSTETAAAHRLSNDVPDQKS